MRRRGGGTLSLSQLNGRTPRGGKTQDDPHGQTRYRGPPESAGALRAVCHVGRKRLAIARLDPRSGLGLTITRESRFTITLESDDRTEEGPEELKFLEAAAVRDPRVKFHRIITGSHALIAA